MNDTLELLKQHEASNVREFGGIRSSLERIEKNHLQHLEADVRTLKEGFERIEKALQSVHNDVKETSGLIQKVTVDGVQERGKLSERIRAVEVSERGGQQTTRWIWDILKIILGTLIGAAATLFSLGR